MISDTDSGKKDVLDVTPYRVRHSKLEMTQHWDEVIWRRFVSTSVLNAKTLMASFGLRTRPSGAGLVIDHPVGYQLCDEVKRIVSKL